MRFKTVKIGVFEADIKKSLRFRIRFRLLFRLSYIRIFMTRKMQAHIQLIFHDVVTIIMIFKIYLKTQNRKTR